jgi:hypothetical protein
MLKEAMEAVAICWGALVALKGNNIREPHINTDQ